MRFLQIAPLAALALAVGLTTARAGTDEPPIDFSGTWKLDRAASDPMREMLKAQGYNALEVGVLERVPVTQIMTQSASGLSIDVRCTVIRTSEQLHFDGQSRSDRNNVLGPLVRTCQWSADGRRLITTIRYNTKSGVSAEMTVSRTIAGAERSRLLQETNVKLADGREFRARQVFVRQDTGKRG